MIPEVVNQIAFEVIGNDVTVTLGRRGRPAAAQRLRADHRPQPVQERQRICATAASRWRERCVNGITANREHLRSGVEHSIGIVTALNPYIGYANATEIAQGSARHRRQRLRSGAGKEAADEGAARPDPAARSADAAAVVHSDHRRRRAAGGDRGAEGNRVRIDRRGGIAPSLRGAKRTKQFILSLRGEMDCFALLAMTADLLAICPRMPG